MTPHDSKTDLPLVSKYDGLHNCLKYVLNGSFNENCRVKQLEHQKAQINSDLHEMDKPLARDKDDQDLDAHLKAIEREEDPMLKYIKKKEKKINSGLPRK